MKELGDFTEQEIERAAHLSPAIANYLRQIHLTCAGFSDEIRIVRHRAWLEAALNTLYNSATTQEICEFWSTRTDEIVQRTWKECGLDGGPLALFALGKLGSKELNLSSDIDLIVVSRHTSTDEQNSQLRSFHKALSEITPRGFVYRLDFDLRPGGISSAMITNIDQFEIHYWSQGESWERLALTRLRGICGDKSLIQEVELLSKRFSKKRFYC